MATDSVREDLGYMRYQLSKTDTYAGKPDKMKIEYTKGLMAGSVANVRRDIAEDLIRNENAKAAE